MTDEAPETSATRAAAAAGYPFETVVFGRVSSLEEAAAKQGVDPSQVLKTLVVRRAEDDHLLVLVPGDRKIAWPKLRDHLGVSRLSLPDADEAFEVTGYVRGTITPFGCSRSLPVIVDETVTGHRTVTVGGGQHGVSLHYAPDDLVAATGATVADITQAR